MERVRNEFAQTSRSKRIPLGQSSDLTDTYLHFTSATLLNSYLLRFVQRMLHSVAFCVCCISE